MKTHRPAEKVEPYPGDLIESLRDFGYTLQSALADLIDNSLTARATKIEIVVHAGTADSHIAILDNGSGMDQQTLIEAMRMGGSGPLCQREKSDLGRFGLGMKTASLSQGRCLTVITRCSIHQEPLVRRWDIRYLQQAREWRLLEDVTPIGAAYLKWIEAKPSGTAVVIEDLDRTTFLRTGIDFDEHLGRTLEIVRSHLSMVFHRFLEESVVIKLGATEIKPWDPFIRILATSLPSEKLYIQEKSILVTPYVLPHHTKMTEEQHEVCAGPNGWNEHQGFYIYRCRRLIVPGTWLNLQLRKEEHFKLARIQVDLPNSMDADWHLNVMKSHVAAPASLREDFKRIAKDVRRQAAEVYRYRGERQVPSGYLPERFVWRREVVRGGVRYRIDRTHPVIRALLHFGCDHEKMLDQVLELVEDTIPVASILQEPVRSIDGADISGEHVNDVANYASLAAHAEQFLIRAGHSPKEARALVMAAEPFVRFRDAISAYMEKGN